MLEISNSIASKGLALSQFLVVAAFSAFVLFMERDAEANFSHSDLSSRQAVDDWEVYQIHPWAFVKEEDLPNALQQPVERLHCWGAQNDWVTTAVGVKVSNGQRRLTVSLQLPKVLEGKGTIRVVGMGNYRGGGFTPDPLFGEGDFDFNRPLNAYLSNWELICEFPKLTVTPEHPAMLWLTFNTHKVPHGEHNFALVFKDENGRTKKLEGRLEVLRAELTVENPLHCFLWQYVPEPPAAEIWVRELIEHGVNVFHMQHKVAHSLGARFIIFFAPSDAFNRKQPIDEQVKNRVKEQVQQILQTVKELGLSSDRWAIYITDEPHDKDIQTVIEYARLIRSVDPEIPFYVTLPWGPGEKNEWITVKGVKALADEGVISVWHPYWYHAWDGSGTWDLMKRTGKPIWIYEILANTPRNPRCGMSFLRLGHWFAYKYRAQGLGIYAGYSFEGDPWNDLDGKNDYYAFYWYGKSGFLSTRALEAFRQGVQEYKLFHALKNAGVPEERIDEQVERAIKAKSPEELDAIRRTLTEQLAKRQARKNE